MKKTFLVAVASVSMLFATSANAQLGVQKVTKKIVPTFTIGAKLGVNMQQMSSDAPAASLEKAFKAGVLGGVFVSVDKNKIGMRIEGLVKTARFGMSAPSTVSINAAYVDIPVLFEYKLIKRVWLQVGPQFSSIISAKTTNDIDVKNNFKNSDVSAVAGLEVDLPMKLTVGARFIQGFVNVNNISTSSEKLTNTSMQFSVGYRFLN